MHPADDASEESAGYAETVGHEPVMLAEVLDYLDPRPGETIVDCTLGGGGYALAICQRLGPTGRLIGVDQDDAALAYAAHRLQGYPVTYVHESFVHLDSIIQRLSLTSVDGYVFDLGVSSLQLDTPERGFSFRTEAPLDLRMDRRNPVTAADLVNRLSERELEELFFASGYERRWARRLARAIVTSRQRTPIRTTTQFADLIAASIPARRRSKIHPATLAFQALRLEINQELPALSAALVTAAHHSNTAARIVAVSYHSLEDGIVKRAFQFLSGKRRPPSNPYEAEEPPPPRVVTVLTPKPLTPSHEEVRRNPRSRSAKLRAVERL